jgi:serine/threonine protein kinase
VSGEDPTLAEFGKQAANPLLKADVKQRLFGATQEARKIGRFSVLERLGAGGMGVVYSAFDDELDRKVAIKLLHANQLGGSEGRTRLMREAQALGKLSHPNVVQVYEVGTHEQHVFVAMEYVRGETLRVWLESPRSLDEILAVMVQAGRGLDAAHHAGLVHRDFKPDNVIVPEDGRVRVLDFGLARAPSGEDTPPADLRSTLDTGSQVDSGGLLASPLTQTGALVGTPAYMAPEQHAGKATGPRTDQFSFAVTLWEAVYGERPFAGSTIKKLSLAVVRGQLRPPPAGRKVPGWLHAAMMRALSTDPAERFEDMGDLLAVLDRGDAKRRRALAVGGGVLALGALALGAALAFPRTQNIVDEACSPSARPLEGTWNDEIRAELERKYSDPAHPPWIGGSWRSLERSMDSLTSEWLQVHAQACEEVGSDQAAMRRLGARRLACLEGGALELRFMSRRAREKDAWEWGSFYRGPFASREQIACGQDSAVDAMPPPSVDPGVREQVGALRAGIIQEAHYQTYEGHPEEGLELAKQATARAKQLGYKPLLADTQALIAAASHQLRLPEAEAAAQEALRTAVSSRYPTVELRLLMLELDTASPETLVRMDALIERLASPPDPAIRLAQHRAGKLHDGGDITGARAIEDELIATFGDDPRVPATLRAAAMTRAGNSGNTAKDRIEDRLVLEGFERARAILDEEFGPGHPTTVNHIMAAAYFHERFGRPAEALEAFEQVNELLAVLYPEGNPRRADTLLETGKCLLLLGRVGEGRESILESEKMLVDLFGSDHPIVLDGPMPHMMQVSSMTGDIEDLRRRVEGRRAAGVMGLMGPAFRATLDALDGKFEAAREEIGKFVAGLDAQPPEEVWGEAFAHAAYVYFLLGDIDTALATVRKYAAWPDSPEGSTGPGIEGWLLVEKGAYDEALPVLERTMLQMGDTPPSPMVFWRGMVEYSLAVALWETGGDRTRAVELARRAVEDAKVSDPPKVDTARRAEAWLAER